jgi:uncharacterized protein
MNKGVDSYIEALPDTKREIAEALRELIFSVVPNVEERLSYKIPMYHYFGMFCYMNEVKQGIDLGFMRGRDLLFAWPQLEARNRAIVASVVLTSKKDILQLNIEALLLGAAAWNEEAKRTKVPLLKSHKKAAPKKKRP